jgi:hypothetical protein
MFSSSGRGGGVEENNLFFGGLFVFITLLY